MRYWIALLLISTNSYAAFCPNNFNQINIGDSTDMVSAACGKADTEKSYTQDITSTLPQEWTYYVQENTRAQTTTVQGNLKMSVVFDNGKVINISVNGIGVGATQVCNSKTIQLGSLMADVKSACGAPINVNIYSAPGSQQPTAPQINEWTYNSNPPVTLTFTNGKLSGIK